MLIFSILEQKNFKNSVL